MNSAAHFGDNFRADGKPQARTFFVPGLVGAVKHIKQFFKFFRRYAGTVVGKVYFYAIFFPAVCFFYASFF